MAVAFTLSSLWGCEDDDDASGTPTQPAVALMDNPATEVEEGNTMVFPVAVFFSGDLDNNVTVNWATEGADTRSGSVVIAAGALSAQIELEYAENDIADGDREVTLTISSSSLPTTDRFGGTMVTFKVLDDLKTFSLGTEDDPDTVSISETAGNLVNELESSAAIDEAIEFTFEVDPASTAVEGIDYLLPNGTTFTVDAGSDDPPAFDVEIINNEMAQAERSLKLNFVSLSASAESSIVPDVANSIVYLIGDDRSIVKIDRIDPDVEINEDTLEITSAGIYEFATLIEGGDITGTVSFEVEPDYSENPAVAASVELISGTSVLYVPGEEQSKPFKFEITSGLFTGSGSTYYITFNLDALTSGNMDEEVGFDTGGEISLVVAITDE